MGRRWVQLVMSKHDKMKFSNSPAVQPEVLIFLSDFNIHFALKQQYEFHYFKGSFRISVRKNSYNDSKMLDEHRVFQGNSVLPLFDICGVNSVGNLCCHTLSMRLRLRNSK